MSRKMKPKKYIKLLVIFFIIAVFAVHIQPDDKELFMGASLSDTPIKPNVIILLDSSGSMNTIIFYPKNGPDRIENNEDDGFDPKIQYSGSIENMWGDLKLSEPQWYARWIRDGDADILDRSDLEGATHTWSGNFWTGCYAEDGTGYNFQVGSNGDSYFREGDKVLYRQTISPYNVAMATIKRKYIGSNGEPWFELEDIKGETIIPNSDYENCHFQQAPDDEDWEPAIVYLYGTRDVWGAVPQGQYEDTRYPSNYLKWMFIHCTEAHRDRIIYFSQYGSYNYEDPNDHTVPPPDWGTLSNCDIGNSQSYRETWTRIQVAKEVLCKVAEGVVDYVHLGIFRFDGSGYASDPEGGVVQDQLWESSDVASDLTDFKQKMWDIKANTWTPLAEALADIWRYYKPGPGINPSYWPSDIEFADGNLANANSPIKYWCQNNFVIVMTDGTSTKDDFSGTKYEDSIFTDEDNFPVKRSTVWEDWSDGWGDTDNNDQSSGMPEDYDSSTATYCPYNSCWESGGTDLLDDVAYLLSHQDMFPDDIFVDLDGTTLWPGDQVIYTYVIGFGIDNDMLRETAANGAGGYYTADDYRTLGEAFQNAIISINLRSFAFSSITAPKKTATATNDELTVSYVGYFIPSASKPIWEGHLLAYRLNDAWGYDADNSTVIESSEYIYETQEECLGASDGSECYRSLALSIGQEWDAAQLIPAPDERKLYTHDSTTATPTANIEFITTNKATLKPLFDSSVTFTEDDAEGIINVIRKSRLGDVFHSDVGFVGPPLYGKIYLNNLNPIVTDAQSYDEYYTANINRRRVLYAGTNEGILHMFYADGIDPGQEVWGFIPDEVLPSLKTIAVDNLHTYTVDGRMTAGDIYYEKSGCSGGYDTCWSTILIFGLRRGGNAFYALDITNVGSQPSILWKYKDDTYSGESWGKPALGKIKVLTSGADPQLVEKWVTVLPAGFAFNSENSKDKKGKAVFVVDASNGDLIWMLGYDPDDGAVDDSNSPDPEFLDVTSDDDVKYLTKSDLFNFSIPSALNAVDRDNDGYLDAIYFGNVGGHFFKTDISSNDITEWTTYVLYEKFIENKAATTISKVEEDKVSVVSNKDFEKGDTVIMNTSTAYASGYITEIDNKVFTVRTNIGTFVQDGPLVVRTYDPIYLSPALAYDTCNQLWVSFGTGDRDRPRSNRTNGRYISFKDSNVVNHIKDSDNDTGVSTLQTLNYQLWGVGDDVTVDNANGWYFDFIDTGEKLFDPEPIIIPDEYLIPHIYFNTYQPPPASVAKDDDLCAMPDEGIMTLYDISLVNCGTLSDIEGDRTTGRIAGGGIYQGKEYVMYTSESGDVADVPGEEEGGQFKANAKRLPYPGGIVFWKEKKR